MSRFRLFTELRANVAALTAVVALTGPLHAKDVTPYIDRPEVTAFANEITNLHQLDRASVLNAFREARHQPAIIRAMEPVQAGQRSWRHYLGRTVTQSRIDDGVQFWAQHRDALARAQARFGIPPEIIVAIIGVETTYGHNTGSWRVLDALTTLAFDYPRRAAFFRTELVQLFLYAKETGTDVAALRGSFAGAIGIPQFMPGSFMRYAIDFDDDGRRDLVTNATDAIGSVGNFLSQHGWRANQPVAFPVAVKGDAHALALSAGIVPSVRIGDLKQYAVTLAETLDEDALCALIELGTPDAPSEFWIGLANFYVITRYNQSSFYALSVHALGQALKAQMILTHPRTAQPPSAPPPN